MSLRIILKNSRLLVMIWKMIREVQLWCVGSYMKKKGHVYQFDGIKSFFYLPNIRTDLIQKVIYLKKNYFEYETLDYVCKDHGLGVGQLIKGGVVLDIGANIGNHTLYFCNECDAKKVYCFEPMQETFLMLQRNIVINHLEDRTILINKGVGECGAKASVSFKKDSNSGFTRLALSDIGDVEIIAIDDLNIEQKIGFVKIDVEGFELAVLKGMVKTLKRDKPFLMVELWDSNFDDAVSVLEGIGYQKRLLDAHTNEYLFYT